MQKQANISPIEESPLLRFDRRRVESEISLVDLWLIVRRGWLLLLAGLLIGVSIAVTYIVWANPTYESRTILRLGNVPGLGLIEDLGVLSIVLNDEYGPKTANGMEARMPYLKEKNARANKTQNNILELVAVGYSPDEARDFVAQISAQILQRHERLYANLIDPLRRRLATIEEQIALLSTQLRDLGELVARLKESNPVQASLVAIERSGMFMSLDQLERDRVTLQQQVTQPNINPSQVIARPELPERPISPRKLIVVVIGMVLGLVLGLVVIFLREFFETVKAAAKPETRST